MLGENVWFFFDEHIFEQVDEPICGSSWIRYLAPVIVQGYSKFVPIEDDVREASLKRGGTTGDMLSSSRLRLEDGGFYNARKLLVENTKNKGE